MFDHSLKQLGKQRFVMFAQHFRRQTHHGMHPKPDDLDRHHRLIDNAQCERYRFTLDGRLKFCELFRRQAHQRLRPLIGFVLARSNCFDNDTTDGAC